MTPLKLFVFGPPRMEHADHPIDLNLRKAVALLVYLAVTAQPQSRDALATLLWPDRNARDGRARLRRALHRLRVALGDHILDGDTDTLRLHSHAELWLDRTAFQQYVEGVLPAQSPIGELDVAQVAHLRSAAALYVDDFLAGWTLPDSSAWDEWQFFERERLRHSLARVLEQLVVAEQSQHDWDAAIGYARRWLALDPLHEPAHRALMRLYAWSGHHAAALRQYQECTRILDDELGTSPDEETVALFATIRVKQLPPLPDAERPRPLLATAAKLESRPSMPVTEQASLSTGLPFETTAFIGRERELADLKQLLLREPTARLVTIVGPGGIGKTQLALKAAMTVQAAFRHGVVFVPLASLTSADQLVASLAEHAGFHFYQPGDPMQQLIDYLREKELLLVLDNFEHLVGVVGVVTTLLHAAPQIKILVTSRERLNLSDEVAYSLGGMTFPEPDSYRYALEYDAIQLLMQRARLVHPGIDLRAYNLEAMVRICQLVQGMPLALVLAAGWLEVLSFDEIATEIAQSLDFLEGSLRDLPDRQQSVRATFDYSWKRLSPDERQAFMKLSVFRGGFTRRAAQVVTGTGLAALRTLAHKSLLTIIRDDRYQLHELLRQFGEEQLQASAGYDRTQDAHSTYYLQFLRERETDLQGQRQLEALEEIEADLGNVRIAWQHALETKNVDAIKYALESLYLFFDMRGRYKEGAELFRLASERSGPTADVAAGRLWGRILAYRIWLQAHAFDASGDMEAEIETSLLIAKQRGVANEIGFSLLTLGAYHGLIARDYQRAQRYFGESFDQFRAVDDHFYMARALLRLGYCRGFTTGFASHLEAAIKSLALAREAGSKVDVALALTNLGSAALGLGDYDASERYSQEARAVAREIGARAWAAHATVQLSLVHFLLGDLAQAHAEATESLASATEINFSITKASAEATLGLVEGVTESYGAARQHGEASLSTPSNPLVLTIAHLAGAIIACGLGDDPAAWRHIHAALTLARQVASPAMMTWPLPVAAILLARYGKQEFAAEVLGLAVSHPLSPRGWVARWPTLNATRAMLESTLGAEIYHAAQRRGAGLELDAVVRDLLSPSPEVTHDR